MDRKLQALDGAYLGSSLLGDRHAYVKHLGAGLEPAFNDLDGETFVMWTWHLINDWIRNSDDPHHRLMRTKTSSRTLPEEARHFLDVLRDISNGSKHFSMKAAKAERRAVSKVHSGLTPGWYQFFFHERIPGITTELNYYFSLRMLRELSLEYLEWVFDDTIAAKPFPGELHWKIWICCVPHRNPGAT